MALTLEQIDACFDGLMPSGSGKSRYDIARAIESAVRKQDTELIALPKRDDLIHTMLSALVQSSPYTDRTYAWKRDAWARQRAEAISAAIAWLGEVRG